MEKMFDVTTRTTTAPHDVLCGYVQRLAFGEQGDVFWHIECDFGCMWITCVLIDDEVKCPEGSERERIT